jgi:hypothetical protein
MPITSSPLPPNNNHDHPHDTSIITIVTALQHDLKHLQNSITSMEGQIEQSKSKTTEDIKAAETRCANRMEDIQSTTAKALHDISATFIDQMKLNQQNTNSVLLQLLETREDSLINRINEKIQNTMNTNKSPTQSPTRKKSTINTINEDKPTTHQNIPNKENHCLDLNIANATTRTPMTNPYQNNSLRRRSVDNTHSTTLN